MRRASGLGYTKRGESDVTDCLCTTVWLTTVEPSCMVTCTAVGVELSEAMTLADISGSV